MSTKPAPKRESRGTYQNLLAVPKPLDREAIERAIEELTRSPDDIDMAAYRVRRREHIREVMMMFGLA